MPKLSNKKHKRKTTKKPNKKIGAQAALDYLVSWGWILIVIVLALVILFSLGVFKAPTAPTIITGFQGITMQAAEANSTMIVFRITNSYNQFVNITGVTVDVNGNNYTSYGCLNNLISTGQSTLCRVLVSIPTKSYISKIQISFTPYKSSIYEISNGTVSSALLSGSIPINNQLTYFVEKGLPYGSTFTVNYNTSTNSTVVSSTNNKVSFNPPFGNYYFSIPSISYQGCNSIPNPSAGYDSTGVGEFIIFTSNCTTTFSETGLPSGQQWQVTFNGTTASNSTGSKIYIRIKNTAGAQAYYTATAKSDNLECVSYDTPSIALGSSYTFGSWNCTTTFNETGLPSGAKWNVTYAGTTNSSTSDTITFIVSPGSFSYSVPSQFASGSEYIPSPSSGTLSAGLSQSIVFSIMTTFTESGLPSGTKWDVTYDGIENSSTTADITFATSSGSYSYSVPSQFASGSEYIPSPSSGTLSAGLSQSIVFSIMTTFTESGLPSGTKWNVTYDGMENSSTTADITFATSSGPYSYSYSVPSQFASGSEYIPSPSSGTLSAGLSQSIVFSIMTTFTESGLPSGTKWNVTYDGMENSSTTADITFATSSGSYSYSIAPTSLPVGPAPNNIISGFSIGGSGILGIAYNQANGDVYFADGGSVKVISSSSNTVISTISGFSVLTGIAYNQANGDVYVIDSGYQDVKVINSSSNTVITTVSGTFSNPEGIAYNQANGDIYVANFGSGTLKVINSSSNTVISADTDSGFSNPEGIAYDQANGDIYVTNYGSDTVSIINSSSYVFISTLVTGSNPEGIAYDQANGDIYVTNYGSSTVSVINSFSNKVITNISVGSEPIAVAYDQANGDVYVENYGSDTVNVISSSSNKVISTISVGSNPYAIAYDQANGEIYVGYAGSDYVTVINSKQATLEPVPFSSSSVTAGSIVPITFSQQHLNLTISGFSNPEGIAYDQANGDLYVANIYGSNNVNVISSSSNKVISTISGGSEPDAVAYDQANGDVYVANGGSNNVNVISSSSNKVISTISVGSESDAVAYDQANGEIYVTTYGNNVNVISSSSNKVISTISVGSAPYGVAYDQANGDIYVTNYGSSTVNVISSSSNKVISTISVGSEPDAVAYDQANGDIYVTNYGSSTVNVISSSSNKVISTISVGSNPYGVAYDQANGDIYVTNYGSSTVSVLT